MIDVTYTDNWSEKTYVYNLWVRISLAGKSNTAGEPRGSSYYARLRIYMYIRGRGVSYEEFRRGKERERERERQTESAREIG